jgi:hypothetical protein
MSLKRLWSSSIANSGAVPFLLLDLLPPPRRRAAHLISHSMSWLLTSCFGSRPDDRNASLPPAKCIFCDVSVAKGFDVVWEVGIGLLCSVHAASLTLIVGFGICRFPGLQAGSSASYPGHPEEAYMSVMPAARCACSRISAYHTACSASVKVLGKADVELGKFSPRLYRCT